MSERIANKLKARAAAWAGQLTALAKSFAPAHVQPAIKSKVEDGKDGKYIIRITADRRIAPDARAQEFGSGLHARRGVKATYVIKPKNKKLLAFGWEVLNNMIEMGGFDDAKFILQEHSAKFVGYSDQVDENGFPKALFTYVDHPGIEAANEGKGYIGPAMKVLRARARAELTKDVKDAIMGDLRESFGRKTK